MSLAHMNESYDTVAEKLEFTKILNYVTRYSVSESGKQRILRSKPHHSISEIQTELRKVTEAKNLLVAEPSIPFEQFKDITLSLRKSDVENQALTPLELIDIATVLRISRDLRGFLSKRRSQYPLLGDYCQFLFVDKILEYNISNALEPQGTVKDTASTELLHIRKKLASSLDALRKSLVAIMRKISEHDFLQEEIITTRDGRLVIPVKVEHKNRVPGFIHTTSASGATVYIEPAETLELNNQIRELQIQEQREIHRILLELTKQVASIKTELLQTFATLSEIDSLFARAKYSIEIQGNEPTFSTVPEIHLIEARHPVLLQHLPRKEVIPLTLKLGGNERTLIITGPNAGGKTVALKLIGLLTLFAQSGFHIPASADSTLYPFDSIFIDIGDEQSIDNDLSSFSSHLLTLKNILERATARSLVLIDEIGTGTDPSEGAAIAIAVLLELTKRGTLTIATTHHGTLKAFASQTSGVVNGSMEFDQKSLRPTYQYKHGIPGSSYAFELAERIGLPQSILAVARDQIGRERAQLEKLLIELEAQAQMLSQRLKETETEKAKLENLSKTYEQKVLQFQKELATLRKQAALEAREIVQNAYAQIEKIIKEIKETHAEKSIIKASKESMKILSRRLAELSDEADHSQEQEYFSVGDRVRVKNGTSVGEITAIENGIAVVLTPSARLSIPIQELQKVDTKVPIMQSSVVSSPSNDLVFDLSSKIDLRGLRSEEAIPKLETFLDKAYSSGIHEVSIIHGKGTGKLRKAITDYLLHSPYIKSFRLGEWNEGGTGITVVEFK